MQFNNAFFDRLGRSAPVVDLVTQVAEKVAANARETAPVKTGHYRDNIKVVLKYQKRVVAVVLSSDPKTMLIESKTGNLARALRRAKKRG